MLHNYISNKIKCPSWIQLLSRIQKNTMKFIIPANIDAYLLCANKYLVEFSHEYRQGYLYHNSFR